MDILRDLVAFWISTYLVTVGYLDIFLDNISSARTRGNLLHFEMDQSGDRAVNIKTIFDEIKIRFGNCAAVDGIQIYFSLYKCPTNSTTQNFIRHPSPVLPSQNILKRSQSFKITTSWPYFGVKLRKKLPIVTTNDPGLPDSPDRSDLEFQKPS